MEAVSVHSQYTSTVRVKVADPKTLLAVIWYSPLSLRLMSAIVKLVMVTVTFASVTSLPFNVMLRMLGKGLASSERRNVNCSLSVGVEVAMGEENSGGSAEQRDMVQSHFYLT